MKNFIKRYMDRHFTSSLIGLYGTILTFVYLLFACVFLGEPFYSFIGFGFFVGFLSTMILSGAFWVLECIRLGEFNKE